MNISELSIRRPVLATVLTIIILLFGLIGYTTLGVREYPSVDNPIISVTCSYSGANADIIESQITEPLQRYSRYTFSFKCKPARTMPYYC